MIYVNMKEVYDLTLKAASLHGHQAAVAQILDRFGADRVPELRVKDLPSYVRMLNELPDAEIPPTTEEWANHAKKYPCTHTTVRAQLYLMRNPGGPEIGD